MNFRERGRATVVLENQGRKQWLESVCVRKILIKLAHLRKRRESAGKRRLTAMEQRMNSEDFQTERGRKKEAYNIVLGWDRKSRGSICSVMYVTSMM